MSSARAAILLATLLCAACADRLYPFPAPWDGGIEDAGEGDRDVALRDVGGDDAGGDGSVDAADADGGGAPEDVGGLPDASALHCELQTLKRYDPQRPDLSLVDLAISSTHLAAVVSYGGTGLHATEVVRVEMGRVEMEQAALQPSFDPATDGFSPTSLSWLERDIFLAGVRKGSSHGIFFSEGGGVTHTASVYLLPLAATITREGALLVGVGQQEELNEAPEQVRAVTFDRDGSQRSVSQPLASALGADDRWGVAWRLVDGSEEGALCGVDVSGGRATLSLYERAEGAEPFGPRLEPSGSSGPLVIASNLAKSGGFACRLALGDEERLVAYSAPEVGAQLVWVAAGSGALRAGPRPFSAASLGAGRFDVAYNGGIGALAFVDGAGRLWLRLFVDGSAPFLELRGEEEDALAAEVGSVRGVAIEASREGQGFILAFDTPRGSAEAAERDLLFRKITCSF